MPAAYNEIPAAYNVMRFIIRRQPGRFDLGCLLTSNQLTLTLPWVKARTGSSMAVGQTLSLPRNKRERVGYARLYIHVNKIV